MKKLNLSIIEMIIVGIICILLLLLIAPGILNIFSTFGLGNASTEAKMIYNTAIEEKMKDKDKVNIYCYKSQYGYPKTLDNTKVKSLQAIQSGKTSYYIEFNEKGGIKEFLVLMDKKAVYLKNVNEVSIDMINKDDIINIDTALKILEKCEYRIQ
ncbi:MAG: hypothetical protein RSD96_01600 [Bacilli bacterium]